MPYLLNIVYLLTLLALSPYLVYKSLTTRKYRRGFAAKFLGRAFHRESTLPCVWFHGVSVGEIHLLKPLLAEFRRRYPGCDAVISTTTDTGYDEACKRFPDLRVLFWPFDFSWAVRAALRAVNPTMVVLAESELWPNFLNAAQERGVPVVVVNGRMSPKSFANWQRILQPRTRTWKALSFAATPVVRRLFATVDTWAVQTHEYALHYVLLGIAQDRIHVTGSIKYDGANSDRDNPQTHALRQLFGIESGELVWVAGSTQEPEETIALDIYRRLKEQHPRLRLFLVPRQKERFEEVARLLAESGLPYVRRSQMDQSGPLAPRVASDSRSESATMGDPKIALVDTIGELSALWGLADVAFVGGSLDGKRGGQNMIEPAAYGAAVLFGPHTWNFRDTVERLLGVKGAVQIKDAAELEREVARLFADGNARQRLGAAAQAFVASQNGATRRTVDLFARWLRLPDAEMKRAA
jgi:3-deoxy-D-manno-octulosonic-acid transferase